MRTPNQERGDAAERLVADRLEAAGWEILGRQLRVGHAEIDLLAIDPGPPPCIVAVEVRWRSRRDFGLAEETVDRRKIRRLRGAATALRERGWVVDHQAAPHLPVRVDLVAVEPAARPGVPRRHDASVRLTRNAVPAGGDVAADRVRFRHHRAVG